MKISRSLLLLLLGFSTACDRQPKGQDAASRQADERRIEELRALEQRAAEREVAGQAALNDAARQKIEADRAEIAREKGRLTDAQRRLERERDSQAREDEARADKQREEERIAAVEAAKRDGAQQARTAQKIDFFYDALDPFGDWIEMDKYGYVWQPAAAQDPRWRPYTDGSWAWTNYGWTWNSKEPFGWAAYHYGRWSRVKRIGWVWVPGSEWAPAWVAWRRSDNYIGWAPLPPDAHSGSGFTAAVDRDYDIGPGSYTFVPVENFGEPTYVGQVIEPERNITIINQTVNVTRVTYRTVENKSVVFNAGPEITVINARSRQPVRQLTVEKVAAQGPSMQKGNMLQLAAPVIPTNAKPAAAPAKIKEHAKGTEVDNGWHGGGDAQAIQKVRAKINQEASEAVDKPAPAAVEAPAKPAPVVPRIFQKPAARPATPEPAAPENPRPPITTPNPLSSTPAAVKSPFSRPGADKRPKPAGDAAPERPRQAPLAEPTVPTPSTPSTPPTLPLAPDRGPANRKPARVVPLPPTAPQQATPAGTTGATPPPRPGKPGTPQP